MTPTRSARQRGQVLVIFVLAIVALLAAAGLAIDIGRFYSERRFLQNGADAAALAAGSVLVRGGTEAEARAEAMAVLSNNFSIPPNGIVPALPPGDGNEVYDSGHAGDPTHLISGILFSGDSVRVGIRNTIPYTFGRAVGLNQNTIVAQAKVKFYGDLLPIAVREYINAPGADTGKLPPCSDDPTVFTDYFATANTSCLGTDTNRAGRLDPNAGAAFDASTPDGDRTDHGPILQILGQGADPDNGSDFRGFIALDIRNFESASSQVYYNGVTSSTNAQKLKDTEAAWILAGGYPGPMFPAVISPPDPNDQVAILSGNSAGIAVSAFADRIAPGDEILVAVYPGITMQIPDFTVSSPGEVPIVASGTTANVGSFKVYRNKAFSGVVTLSTIADTNDPNTPPNPLVLGTMLTYLPPLPATDPVPLTYTPNAFQPALGSGTTVQITHAETSGAADGIYGIWLKGQAGTPYLTTKYTPFEINVGGVTKDFGISTTSNTQSVAAVGDTATFDLTVTDGKTAFGSTVSLSLEALPGASLPAGIDSTSVSFSPPVVSPTRKGATSTLTINTSTLTQGTYQFVVRATGPNGSGQPVTHLTTITVEVATSSTTGHQDYVDIVGFAVMRVAAVDSNSVSAYAITPVISDPNDSRLRRGQVARLAPWN